LNNKLKLPWQSFHNPTNPKQSKFSQNSTILKIAKFLSAWNTSLFSGGSSYCSGAATTPKSSAATVIFCDAGVSLRWCYTITEFSLSVSMTVCFFMLPDISWFIKFIYFNFH
jgi:hypothetical protein